MVGVRRRAFISSVLLYLSNLYISRLQRVFWHLIFFLTWLPFLYKKRTRLTWPKTLGPPQTTFPSYAKKSRNSTNSPELQAMPGRWAMAHEHMSRHAKYSMRALLTRDLATNSKPPMWAFGGQMIPAHFFLASRAGPFYSLLRRQARDLLNCLTAILKSEADYCQRVIDAQLDTCARIIEETDDAELLPKFTQLWKSTLMARALRQVTKLRDATTFTVAKLSAVLVEEKDSFTTVSNGPKQPSNWLRSRSGSPHARPGPCR